MWKGKTCSNDKRRQSKVSKPEQQCWTAGARLHRPEPDDGAFLADVALGLVLGGLSGSHTVQDGQPHHRLRLQAHPVQEHGSLQLGFIVGLDTETDKNNKLRIFQMDFCLQYSSKNTFTKTFTKAPSLSFFLRINLIGLFQTNLI